MYGFTLHRVAGANVPLRDFLMTDCGISRKMLTQIKQGGLILVNGEPAAASRAVAGIDRLVVAIVGP